MATTSSSSCTSTHSSEAFIASLDHEAIVQLALSTHDPHASANVTCTVLTPPEYGAYNVVYTLHFSDDTRWVMRIPFGEWTATRARSMRLNVVAQQHIQSHTSVPIPRIRAYDCSTANALGHPYTIADFVPGRRLVDVWYDAGWWTGARTKERFIRSVARHMVDLARLEFSQIGRLDCAEPDGTPFIGPFESSRALNSDLPGPDTELGPFTSTHAFLSAVLALRRRSDDLPALAALQLFVGALPDRAYDGPPFHFEHPDLDSQNLFVDEATGDVAGIIDWDGVAVVPREIGALTYPSWITVDWDPQMYSQYRESPNYDTEADLDGYRRVFLDEVGKAGTEEMAGVTRNSHVVSTLYLGLVADYSRPEIVNRLGKYVFGSSRVTSEVLEGLEHAAWFNQGPDAVAEVTEWDV
ncbi:kinase-like protein [Auriscalpium vulgare]|uniref:Kinase-like protein n=1 Tax=Auriscalpium vulgare TaxID=40419 RepID=A0ACB8RN44_9AGAM|nr:kinase-like protein [Auriscalpium vulgare]